MCAHHRPDHRDGLQDGGDAALVEHVHRHAGADQLAGDVGLQVRETQHQVGFERQDLVDLGGEKGVTRDADDAVLLAQQVEDLGGLFGQADDAARVEVGRRHCRSRRSHRSGEVCGGFCGSLRSSLMRLASSMNTSLG